MDDGERSGHSRSLCLADHRHPRSLASLVRSFRPLPSAPPLRYRFRLLTFASTLRYAPDERREDGSSGGERQERRSDCKTRGSFRPFLTLSLSVPLIVLPSWPGTGGPKGRASPHESDERNVKRADDV